MSDVNEESLDYEDYAEMDGNADDAEDESSEEYDYTDDFCDDAQFDGFLKSNAEVDADLVHDQIMNFLRLGIDPKRSEGLAKELIEMADSGYKKQVSDGIVEFVCSCPPSNVEMVQRFQCVQAVAKIWKEFGDGVTTAINDILDPEKPPLNRIPSRNLANFLRVLVDENIIDKDKILISGTRECSLSDPYLERLHQVLYQHYGCGNPKAPKPTPAFTNFFNNILPSSSSGVTSTTTAPAPSTTQASNQPSSSTNTPASDDALPNIVAPAETPSAISSFVNSMKKIITGSAPSSSS